MVVKPAIRGPAFYLDGSRRTAIYHPRRNGPDQHFILAGTIQNDPAPGAVPRETIGWVGTYGAFRGNDVTPRVGD
jgi:hypothetical protein